MRWHGHELGGGKREDVPARGVESSAVALAGEEEVCDQGGGEGGMMEERRVCVLSM